MRVPTIILCSDGDDCGVATDVRTGGVRRVKGRVTACQHKSNLSAV